jgi:hypothetical protein
MVLFSAILFVRRVHYFHGQGDIRKGSAFTISFNITDICTRVYQPAAKQFLQDDP